jgi:uncharacterized protein (TIGR02466 family)
MDHVHHAIFPTLVTMTDLSNSVDLQVVVDKVKNYQGHTDSHKLLYGGISSIGTTGNFLNDPDMVPLQEAIQQALTDYTQTVGLIPVVITNSWFNYGAEWTKSHRHEGSVISGAFYPDSTEGYANLQFESPIRTGRMNDMFSATTEYSSHTCEIAPQPGMLVLFPSWLVHSTEQNQVDNKIVISFNTSRFYER